MNNYIEIFLNKIENINPKHAIKLRSNLAELDSNYYQIGNSFFEKYEKYLLLNNLTLDFGINCYLKMLDDMVEERINFIKNGTYSNSSFTEVEKKVYANSEVMVYHMHGLVLAQFLWFDQYERIKFFVDNLFKYFQKGQKYLEIGGGHGLFVNEALKILPATTQFHLVDISESSLTLAKGIINSNRVECYLKNIFDFHNDDCFDFVTIGEVLEHLEDPLSLLKKINNFLNKNGVCYLTTPINSPMIDHIYLFKNEQEIRDLIKEADFEILQEKIVISEKIATEKAVKFKVPIMYATFIKKIN